MSTEAVESVLSRAMSDTAFADTLFANAEKALAGFDLTGEEVEKFKGLARADFDTLMASPEGRKSFSIFSNVVKSIGDGLSTAARKG